MAKNPPADSSDRTVIRATPDVSDRTVIRATPDLSDRTVIRPRQTSLIAP